MTSRDIYPEKGAVKEEAVSPEVSESYFQCYREEIIGNNVFFDSHYGRQKQLYADWLASGRLYGPIEEILRNKVGPYVANTHSFSSETGKITTYTYRYARQIIREHVHAGKEDILITTGTGMTAALSKLIRILGLRNHTAIVAGSLPQALRPVVFMTHMEHHSNQVAWLESLAEVVILPPGGDLGVEPQILRKELNRYKDRPLKIGAFTACSNVTGFITPYHELSKIMHDSGGYCFVDFAASAPYVDINMHPEDHAHLDAIAFSPHKFLGGPGSCGVLVLNKSLYRCSHPDNPGGGNVKWTNPAGEFSYFDDPEVKEDGGTPGFLQVIKAALAIRLKEKMGVARMKEREAELLQKAIRGMKAIPDLFILGDNYQGDRIGCISFGIKGIHYNLLVRLLNDRFGIQVRGGWSCASTYGHFLFGLNETESNKITKEIEQKNLSRKPGWVRLSLHPTMQEKELDKVLDALELISQNHKTWASDYRYNQSTNEFDPLFWKERREEEVKLLFEL